jgi:type I restriction enzyme S subunit
MNVLLSIKPQYVDRILSGEKKFEFRRRIFRRQVESAYVYCNSHVKRIVGAFTVGKILSGTQEQIWDMCGREGGIEKEAFFRYFSGAPKAYAIEIVNFYEFDEAVIPELLVEKFYPPQSFYYVPSWIPACTYLHEDKDPLTLDSGVDG